MPDKESAKQVIRELIEGYNDVAANRDLYKTYNEEMTKIRFINPLFQALGWDIENKNRKSEVTFEDKISNSRVDYGFRIDGIPKFFLEAKGLKANIEDLSYAKQAIEYSWNKGCTWAVLTDFEKIKIFNAEVKVEAGSDFSENKLIEMSCQEYLERFDDLWLLSKESFLKGVLDKEAEKWGKERRAIPIDDQLLSDLTRFRELLSKSIVRSNPRINLTKEDIDEAVQRILDRLIFIRYCEDKGHEERKLLSSLREWQSAGKGKLIGKLREVYQHYDEFYNSTIFKHRLCDDIEIEDNVLSKIIHGLHFAEGTLIPYNFAFIDVDILGSIYEEYLGYVLKKTKKNAILSESEAQKDELAIYYTPIYIVEYIVNNTIGKLLQDKKQDPQTFRVLDLSCGSGSFLTKAFEVLDRHYLQHDKDYAQTTLDTETGAGIYTRRLKILRENIFGVDLDKKAIEIAQLNLLLKVAEKKHRLPVLQQNIKQGNSLIEDHLVIEDEIYLPWKGRFPDIIGRERGFGVIIGNPPYDILLPSQRGKNFEKELKYLRETDLYGPALGGRTNLFRYMIIRALTLLKPEGYFGFIVPLALINDSTAAGVRKFILENFQIVSIDCFSQKDDPHRRVFKRAKISTCVIIVKNSKSNEKFFVRTYPGKYFSDEHKEYSVTAEEIMKFDPKLYSIPMVSTEEWKLLKRLHLNERFTTFEEIAESFQGEMNVTNYKKHFTENPQDLTMLKGVEIGRYRINSFIRQGKKEWFSKRDFEMMRKDFRRYNHIQQQRIATQQITGMDDSWRLKAVIVPPGTILANTTNYLLAKEGADPLLLCGLLNSKLMDWRFRKTSTNNHVNTYELDALPIPKKLDIRKVKELTSLVERILELNAKLEALGGKNTDTKSKHEEQICELDKKVNDLVYDLYGISEEERRMIEVKPVKAGLSASSQSDNSTSSINVKRQI